MIFLSLCYNNIYDVEYGFFNIYEMEQAWNMNIDDEFNPLWINILYKIMMEWIKSYARAFMCLGRKPLPFVNERNATFCGLTYY